MSNIVYCKFRRWLAFSVVLGGLICVPTLVRAQYVPPPTPGHKCENCPAPSTPVEGNNGENGSSENPRDIERRRAFNLGLQAFNEERWREAEAYFANAIRLGPDAPAYTNLGLAIFHQGRYAEAEIYLREALRLDKNSIARHGLAETLNRMGIDLANQKQWAEAEAKFREALKLDSKSGHRYRNLGVILQEQGRYKEAEAAYRKALKLDPNDTDAQNNLASLPTESDLARLATTTSEYVAEARKELASNPRDPDKHVKLGWNLILDDQFKKGIRAYQEAGRLRPNDPEIYKELGNELRGVGLRPYGYAPKLFAEAEAAYREAIRRTPPNQIDYRSRLRADVGEMLEYQGNLRSALLEFRGAERDAPNNPWVLLGLGEFLYRQHDYQEALVTLRRAVENSAELGFDFFKKALADAETALAQESNAAGQLNVADEAGRAARAAEETQASAVSRVPFDNGGTGTGGSSASAVRARRAEANEPVIPPERRTPVVVTLEAKRNAVRTERVSLVKQLEDLRKTPRSSERDVKIAEVKQNISTAEAKEIFFTIRIDEEIQKPPLKEKAPETSAQKPPRM